MNGSERENCINCRRNHQFFYFGCPVLLHLKLINTVSVYINVDKYLTQRLIKQQNIKRVEKI